MTERVQTMLKLIQSKNNRKERVSEFWDLPGFHQNNEFDQSTIFLTEMLARQKPLIFDQDIFGFNRYLIDRPGKDANSHMIIDGIKFFHYPFSELSRCLTVSESGNAALPPERP